MVTVPAEVCPPVTGFGEKVNPVIVPLPAPVVPVFTVRPAERELLAVSAVIVAIVVVETGVVAMSKLAVVWPAGITTRGGGRTAPWLLYRRTNAPGPGAGCAIVT